MTDYANLAKMAEAASHDERLSDGMLYRNLATALRELVAKITELNAVNDRLRVSWREDYDKAHRCHLAAEVELHKTEADRDSLRAQVAALKAEVASANKAERDINESLNRGDGSYRP
jgi:predicted  nucleic acid-binding Zn-ribbon protein